MSYINATDWDNIQISGAENEKRFSEKGIINAVKQSTQFIDYMSPSAKAALSTSSSLRQTEIPVIKDQTVLVNQSPGFSNIPTNLEESAKYNFTAVDVFSGFRHYPGTYENNMIDGEAAKQAKMKNIAAACADTIESLLAVQLEARKTQLLDFTTQISQGDGTYAFNPSPDVLEVNKAAQNETMFAALEQVMTANKLGGSYELVTSPAGLYTQRVAAAKFGAGNEKNLSALGFFDASKLHETHNISTSANFDGWLLRDGSIGMFENFPWDFRNGTTVGSKQWSISNTEIPFTRMRANVYTNTEAVDATSLITAGNDSNSIMTHWEEMAIWFRFYITYPYNSDLSTRASDIVKIQGLTT